MCPICQQATARNYINNKPCPECKPFAMMEDYKALCRKEQRIGECYDHIDFLIDNCDVLDRDESDFLETIRTKIQNEQLSLQAECLELARKLNKTIKKVA